MHISLKRISYIVYFIALASVFSLIYYGGYYYAVNYMKSDNLVTKEEVVNNNPGVKSDDETLLNVQLISFSPDSVVIRKTICNQIGRAHV